MKRSARSAAILVALGGLTAAVASQTPTIGQLVKDLRSRDDGRRLTAAVVLAELGPAAKRAASALAKVLDDDSEQVARAAAVALGKIGPPAKRYIKKALRDRDVQLRVLPAVVALGADAVDLLPDVAKIWRAETIETSRAVNACLTQLGAHAVPFLRKRLKDRHDSYQAARVLGDLGPVARDAVPDLIELSDSVHFGSTSAISALGRIGDPAAVPHLVELLETATSNDEFVSIKAWYALTALGRIGPAAEAALPDVLAMFDLEEATESLVGAVADAVAGIGDTCAATMRRLDEVRARGGKFEAAVKEAMATLKPGSGATEAVLMRNAMGHKRPALREAAIRELAVRKASPEAVEVLAKAVADGDKAVALAAIEALGGWGAEADKGYDELAKIAAGDDLELARAATAAMAKIRDR